MLNEPQFDIEDAITHLQTYLDTYTMQSGYKDYPVEIWIDDMIYGLGISIDPDKYMYADGFDEFKEILVERFNK